MNYYNEKDKKAAAWLRVLIAHNIIAPRIVDERSIEDVRPADLAGFTQCHFFAGIGVWSYALRSAGWPDGRRVWTGSCPCQPFSAAGKGNGFDDERHLWPTWLQLIAQCRPDRVYGEQVASKDGLAWLDLVYADLEETGYAVGATDLCAAGVGAPHIRQRSWFVAYDDDDGWRQGYGHHKFGTWCGPADHCGVGGLADAERPGLQARPVGDLRGALGHEEGRLVVEPRDGSLHAGPGPTNGHWGTVDWIFCRDGKWRPVEPGLEPLAHGAPARVGRLRGYGNAIVAQAAQVFIEATLDLGLDQ